MLAATIVTICYEYVEDITLTGGILIWAFLEPIELYLVSQYLSSREPKIDELKPDSSAI